MSRTTRRNQPRQAEAVHRNVRRIRMWPKISSLFFISTCVCFGAEIFGISVPQDVSYVGGAYNPHPKRQFEAYLITGISSVKSEKPVRPTESPKKGIYVATPGERKVAVAIKASADSWLPGLKDGKVELAAHLE
jgi:hypothetical protein